MTQLAHPLKNLRKSRGWTIGELAELTGLHPNTIVKIERGTSPYRTHYGVALLLSEALDCKVDDIFAPGELSGKGRPPLTGTGTNVRITTVVEFTVCPRHFLALPASGVCDECAP